MSKGSFSYKQDKKFRAFISETVGIYIARISNEAARIYFKNPSTGKLLRCRQVGNNVRLENEDTHEVQYPHLNQFVIVWTGSYSLYVDDRPVMYIDNQRQQSVRCSLHSQAWRWNPENVEEKGSIQLSDTDSINSSMDDATSITEEPTQALEASHI